MHYVYLLQSAVDHRRHYTGFTHNLRARLARHNAGQNQSTVQGRPWHLVSYFAFADETKARDFERYLKSGSGKTFANAISFERIRRPARSVRVRGWELRLVLRDPFLPDQMGNTPISSMAKRPLCSAACGVPMSRC